VIKHNTPTQDMVDMLNNTIEAYLYSDRISESNALSHIKNRLFDLDQENKRLKQQLKAQQGEAS